MRFRLFLVVSFAALSVACRPETPAARLARQLRGAYPEHAAPRGVVRTFDIEAREAELPLIDGGKLRVWAYNGQVPGPELRIRLQQDRLVRDRESRWRRAA